MSLHYYPITRFRGNDYISLIIDLKTLLLNLLYIFLLFRVQSNSKCPAGLLLFVTSYYRFVYFSCRVNEKKCMIEKQHRCIKAESEEKRNRLPLLHAELWVDFISKEEKGGEGRTIKGMAEHGAIC